jgi:predicted ATPase
MIHGMHIKNFKSIRELELKQLGKLNVFIGPNNSGKSSVLQAVALIAQSTRNSIQYQGKFVDVGSFNEAVFAGKTRNKIDIELEFILAEEMKDFSWLGKFRAYPQLTKFEIIIGQGGIEQQILKSPTNEITCKFYREEINGLRTVLKFNDVEVNREGSDLPTILGWYVKKPSRLKIEEYPVGVDEIAFINRLVDSLVVRLRNVYYFSTTRAIKQWQQTLGVVDSFGATGEHAISMLHHIYSNEPSIFEKISKWVKKLGVGRLISSTKGANASIILEDPVLNKRVNIINCGFGVNQLLSVIGECFGSPPRSTIMIEEPEIHLHAGAVGTLIDMFLETISENKQILITTHSDRLVFELWARLKLGLVKSEDIRLYLIDKDSKGTFVKQIKLEKRISELRKELQILFKPESPLEDLLKVAGKSGDKRLSEKDLSQI